MLLQVFIWLGLSLASVSWSSFWAFVSVRVIDGGHCWWSLTGGGLLLVLEKLQCVHGLFPPWWKPACWNMLEVYVKLNHEDKIFLYKWKSVLVNLLVIITLCLIHTSTFSSVLECFLTFKDSDIPGIELPTFWVADTCSASCAAATLTPFLCLTLRSELMA